VTPHSASRKNRYTSPLFEGFVTVVSAVASVTQGGNTMATSSQLADALFPRYEFIIRRSEDHQFYWVLHNTRGNTESFAISELYTTKQSCQESIATVKRVAAAANVVDESGTRGLIG
jgi:uncharacterized protein YegP (UPF0339 family)